MRPPTRIERRIPTTAGPRGPPSNPDIAAAAPSHTPLLHPPAESPADSAGLARSPNAVIVRRTTTVGRATAWRLHRRRPEPRPSTSSSRRCPSRAHRHPAPSELREQATSAMSSPASVGLSATLAPARAQRLDLGHGGSLATRHDRYHVAHLLARRHGYAGDVCHHRLRHRAVDERHGLLFGGSPDLADHHHRPGLGIGFERLEAVDEARSRYGVAADTHAGRHPDALLLQLVQRLVRQRSRATHDPDGPTRLPRCARR